MKRLTLIVGGIYGLVSVILGALAAHALNGILTQYEKLEAFETAVRYQMYHALLLLILGFFFSFKNKIEKTASWCIIIGAFLFPVSIYFLSFSDFWGINIKWLGPITPLGGVFMIIGWTLLIYIFAKGKQSE